MSNHYIFQIGTMSISRQERGISGELFFAQRVTDDLRESPINDLITGNTIKDLVEAVIQKVGRKKLRPDFSWEFREKFPDEKGSPRAVREIGHQNYVDFLNILPLRDTSH